MCRRSKTGREKQPTTKRLEIYSWDGIIDNLAECKWRWMHGMGNGKQVSRWTWGNQVTGKAERAGLTAGQEEVAGSEMTRQLMIDSKA